MQAAIHTCPKRKLFSPGMRLRAEIVGGSTGAIPVSVWTAQHVGAVPGVGVRAHKLVGSHLYRDVGSAAAGHFKDIMAEEATVHAS
jgi:hypothetical protein